MAKAFLSGFKFDHLIQEIREGEGAALADHGSVEVTMNVYKVADNGTLTAVPDVRPVIVISPLDSVVRRPMTTNRSE